MQKLTMVVYILFPSHKIADTVGAFFKIILLTDVSVFVRAYLYMWRKCIVNTYVSESFVCSKFYIGADLTDLRKNFKQPISLFLAHRDYIEKFSTDCCAIVVGAMFDKQLSEHCVYAKMGQFLFRVNSNKRISVGKHHFGKD